jgi:biotin synthase-related radical SAM superfamily protein
MHRYWVGNFKMLGKKGLEASKAARRVLASHAWKDSSKIDEIIQKIQETLDNSGVICLTDTAQDRRMWEEYAGGHRGVCLCFETSGSPFSTARYVSYMAELPIVKISADSGEKVEAFLLTKGSSYSWEREWRFVDYNKGNRTANHRGPAAPRFPRPASAAPDR